MENLGKKSVDEAEDLMVRQVIGENFPKKQEILLDLWWVEDKHQRKEGV